MVVGLNSGVLSPTMPSTVSHGQEGVNGTYTRSDNNHAFVFTNNIVAKDSCEDWKGQ